MLIYFSVSMAVAADNAGDGLLARTIFRNEALQSVYNEALEKAVLSGAELVEMIRAGQIPQSDLDRKEIIDLALDLQDLPLLSHLWRGSGLSGSGISMRLKILHTARVIHGPQYPAFLKAVIAEGSAFPEDGINKDLEPALWKGAEYPIRMLTVMCSEYIGERIEEQDFYRSESRADIIERIRKKRKSQQAEGEPVISAVVGVSNGLRVPDQAESTSLIPRLEWPDE